MTTADLGLDTKVSSRALAQSIFKQAIADSTPNRQRAVELLHSTVVQGPSISLREAVEEAGIEVLDSAKVESYMRRKAWHTAAGYLLPNIVAVFLFVCMLMFLGGAMLLFGGFATYCVGWVFSWLFGGLSSQFEMTGRFVSAVSFCCGLGASGMLFAVFSTVFCRFLGGDDRYHWVRWSQRPLSGCDIVSAFQIPDFAVSTVVSVLERFPEAKFDIHELTMNSKVLDPILSVRYCGTKLYLEIWDETGRLSLT